MAVAKRRGKTLKQRQEEAERLHGLMASQVEQLRSSQGWSDYLTMLSSFHSYSWSNLMLIWAQRPNATRVAGFRKWQTLGRQVRKGERAIKIRGFSTKKLTDVDAESGEETERRAPRFPILSVFDISQTDLIDGAEDFVPARKLTGEDPAGIYQSTQSWITDQGWAVSVEPITFANGYTDPVAKRIVIGADHEPAQAAKTLLHETAHALMHADQDAGEYVAHRGRCEVEAESVAYVVAGIFGLDTADYSIGYVTSWSQRDPELIQDTAQNVLHTVQQLTTALTCDETTLAA